MIRLSQIVSSGLKYNIHTYYSSYTYIYTFPTIDSCWCRALIQTRPLVFVARVFLPCCRVLERNDTIPTRARCQTHNPEHQLLLWHLKKNHLASLTQSVVSACLTRHSRRPRYLGNTVHYWPPKHVTKVTRVLTIDLQYFIRHTGATYTR